MVVVLFLAYIAINLCHSKLFLAVCFISWFQRIVAYRLTGSMQETLINMSKPCYKRV